MRCGFKIDICVAPCYKEFRYVYAYKITADRVKSQLKNLTQRIEIAGHYDIEVSEIEIMPDHIHLLAGAPPRIAAATIAQVLKSVSTKLLFERYPWLSRYYWGGEIWEAGYFVRSVGSGLTKEKIARYIRKQSSER